jgi:hypothetical protein
VAVAAVVVAGTLLTVLVAQGVAVLVVGLMRAQLTQVVAEAEVKTVEPLTAAQAALALSSLKCLTMLAQHSLVVLHPACPHLSLGSMSTL